MDSQIEKRFLDLENQIKENNTLIKKLHSIQRLNLIFRCFYWLVIIGLSFGAFYFVKPFLGQLGAMYGMGGVGDLRNINSLLQEIQTNSLPGIN